MSEIKTGQIVNIRNRLWRIDSIYRNELSATFIDGIQNFQKRFYIPFALKKILPVHLYIFKHHQSQSGSL